MKKITCFFGILLFALLLPVFTATAYAYSCPDCGSEMGFRRDDDARDADCTNGGRTCYYCFNCKAKHYIETEPLGHNYSQRVIREATCSEEGLIELRCRRCGETREESVPTLEHEFEGTVTEPTCTEDGMRDVTCTVCGYSLCEPIPAAGHSYVVRTNEPTCTRAGERSYVCSVCGDRQVEAIPATGHSYREAVSEPTCTRVGLRIRTCTVCLDRVTGLIPATGHSYGEETVVKEASVFSEGCVLRVCTVCGYTDYKITERTVFPVWESVLLAVCVLVLIYCIIQLIKCRKDIVRAVAALLPEKKKQGAAAEAVQSPAPVPAASPPEEVSVRSEVPPAAKAEMPPAKREAPPVKKEAPSAVKEEPQIRKKLVLLSCNSRYAGKLKNQLEADAHLDVRLSQTDEQGQRLSPSLVIFCADSYSELMESTRSYKLNYPGIKLAVVAGSDVEEDLLRSMVGYGHICGYCRYGEDITRLGSLIK